MKIVYHKKSNLISKVDKEISNEFYVLNGFTNKIKYVKRIDECEEVRKSSLTIPIDLIGYDNFYQQILSQFHDAKKNLFNKRYRFKEGGQYPKSLINDLNNFLAMQSCYDLDEDTCYKILDILKVDKSNIKLPYIKENDIITNVSGTHFYYVVIKIICGDVKIPIKCKFPIEYTNIQIKTYYEFLKNSSH